MDKQIKSKFMRFVVAAGEAPKPLFSGPIELFFAGLVQLRKSLEYQPHTGFKKKEKAVPPKRVVTPPPFRH